MTLLKIHRDAAGMTQSELARRLGTTQQSYARWEGGQSRVPDEAMRELASIFSTTIDKLVERKPMKASKAPSPQTFDQSEKFWGHIGVRQPDAALTSCFAISVTEADKVRAALGNYQIPEWLVVHTLSGCVLAVRPKHVRIWLVDDGDDWPGPDWEQTSPWGKGCGASLKLYKAMAAWADQQVCGGAEFSRLPPKLRHEVLEAVEHSGFTKKPHKLAATLRATVIHSIKGSTETFEAQRADLVDLFEDIDGVLAPEIIALAANGDRFETFIPANFVSMIEMPIIELAADLQALADD